MSTIIINDFLITLYWWFILFGIGIIFLPLAAKIFPRFYDRGYLFAKVLGLGVLSYFNWFLAHLKIIPFTQVSLLTIFGGTAIILAISLSKKSSLKKNLAGKNLKLIFFGEELIFLLTLLFWGFIRGHNPEIQSLEKFMDYGFLNSILRSRFFPPEDMWFAGNSINYYYYGHYLAAFLTKLSGLDSAITYNLMIATLFAFTFVLTFSLTSNLCFLAQKKQPKTNDQRLKTVFLAGLLSAFLICFASNLHTPYYILKDGAQKYWYPDATRYIGYNPPTNDKTIHEFPAYSFVVADLHGHVSDLPFVLTFLALSLSLFLNLKNKKKKSLSLPFAFCVLSLSLMYMTNAWDFPIYLLFLGIILLGGNLLLFLENKKILPLKIFRRYPRFWPLAKTGLSLLTLAIAWFIFTIPFNLNFTQIPQGIGLVHTHTPPFQFLILWGALLFFSLTFAIFFFKNSDRKSVDYFVFFMLLTAFILLLVPEVVYVKDIYSADYYRANTMFKFTYQAYALMTIAVGFIIFRLLRAISQKAIKVSLGILFSLLVALLLIYPCFSLAGYYGKIGLDNYHGLYGLNFLAKSYPEDYQAILWLKENISGQPVVLEASGDSYTNYNRVSALTGLPTIQGWLVHEWLWRGGYDEPAKRATEVEKVYQSGSIEEAKEILKRYQVEYIFFGSLEKEKYPQADTERLESLGKPIFKAGKTVVYKIEKGS
ncbi:hypothetical protein KBI33_02455 [Candidatus Shapirobacteria bacterium]|nr:hypothetical protein [Candidatus Shapirobacteria bacterium]